MSDRGRFPELSEQKCDDDESWPGRHGPECDCECCGPELAAIQDDFKREMDELDDKAYAETGETSVSPWPSPKCYGPHHWRRWRLTAWAASKLYTLGVSSGTSYSGRCNDYACQGHPGGGWIVRMGRPCWPGRGSYLMGMQTDWLFDTIEHLWHVHDHWPLWVHGFCGRCAPWPCCGAVGEDHAPDCKGDE